MPVKLAIIIEVMKHHHHHVGVFPSTIPQIFSVTQLKLRLLRTRGGSCQGAGSTLSRIAGRSTEESDFVTDAIISDYLSGPRRDGLGVPYHGIHGLHGEMQSDQACVS